MNNENIYNLLEEFNNNIIILSENLESKIKEVNEILFNKEFKVLLDNHAKKVDNKFKLLLTCNSNNITIMDKIVSKGDFGELTNKQIFEDDIKKLNDIKNEIRSFIKYGLEEKKDENLIYFKLPYDFTEIKDKQYNLKYLKKKVETNHDFHKGYIYIINNENNDKFKNSFSIEIKENEVEYDDISENEKENLKEVDEKKEDKKETEDKNKNKKEDNEKIGDIKDIIKEDEKEDNKKEGEIKEIIKEDIKKIDDIKEIIKEDEKEYIKKEGDIKEIIKEDEKEDIKKEYKITDFIDFKNAKKFTFSKYEFKNEKKLKI